MGFILHYTVARVNGGLLPRLFTFAPTYTCMKQAGRGSLFSVTLSVAPILLRGTPDCRSHDIGSQGILLFGVRTFLPDYASERLLEPACCRQAFLFNLKNCIIWIPFLQYVI